jgi:hypothetical protein
LAIVADFVRTDASLHDMLVAILRDELADVARQTLSEIRLEDE